MYCVPVTCLLRRLGLAASLFFLPVSIALAQPAAAQGGRGGGGAWRRGSDRIDRRTDRGLQKDRRLLPALLGRRRAAGCGWRSRS